MHALAALRVCPAGSDDFALIEQMMETYLPELGGSAPYPRLEAYWKESHRLPYLLCTERSSVGFALVERIDEQTHDLR